MGGKRESQGHFHWENDRKLLAQAYLDTHIRKLNKTFPVTKSFLHGHGHTAAEGKVTLTDASGSTIFWEKIDIAIFCFSAVYCYIKKIQEFSPYDLKTIKKLLKYVLQENSMSDFL